ncbi:hypothetical protein [Pseudomonas sp. NC02]|uniref:hypothetical protein n=1 Tax=Pseudomonas sp. NC02 TaxID=2067572 RepID=UPI001319F813|nr:hypothetical protein [Pseudomonas sp. NC02]
MLIQSIQLNNFLSFGASSAVIPLGPLNVIIGPNGSPWARRFVETLQARMWNA